MDSNWYKEHKLGIRHRDSIHMGGPQSCVQYPAAAAARRRGRHGAPSAHRLLRLGRFGVYPSC